VDDAPMSLARLAAGLSLTAALAAACGGTAAWPPHPNDVVHGWTVPIHKPVGPSTVCLGRSQSESRPICAAVTYPQYVYKRGCGVFAFSTDKAQEVVARWTAQHRWAPIELDGHGLCSK
jgi:hypothetical protein